jgi:hypothetical protein
MSRKIIIWFLLTLFSASGFAEERKTEDAKEGANPLTVFFVMEGLAGVNSLMASANPKLYGGAAMLLFPMAGCPNSNKTACTAGLITAESLAVYNLTLDPHKKTKGEIFRSNMIGWQILAGVIGTSSYLTKDKTQKLSIAPLPTGGGFVTYNRKF